MTKLKLFYIVDCDATIHREGNITCRCSNDFSQIHNNISWYSYAHCLYCSLYPFFPVSHIVFHTGYNDLWIRGYPQLLK